MPKPYRTSLTFPRKRVKVAAKVIVPKKTFVSRYLIMKFMFVVIEQFRGAKPPGTPCTSVPSYLIGPGSAFVLLSSYSLVWSFPG